MKNEAGKKMQPLKEKEAPQFYARWQKHSHKRIQEVGEVRGGWTRARRTCKLTHGKHHCGAGLETFMHYSSRSERLTSSVHYRC